MAERKNSTKNVMKQGDVDILTGFEEITSSMH